MDDPNIIVIGSQAILGSYGEDQLPLEAVRSMEADIAFLDDPRERKSEAVDGAIGEGSSFHSMNAYYAQGVAVGTATLPDGWEDRVVAYERRDAEPSRAVCLEPHDLVVSKLVAGREKDKRFCNGAHRCWADRSSDVARAGCRASTSWGSCSASSGSDTIGRCARRAAES